MVKSKSPLDKLVFRRDENGCLVEKELFLKNGDNVFLIPLTIGEITRLSIVTEEYIINYLLTNNVKNPVFTGEDVKLLLPEYVRLFVDKIYEISGVKTKKSKKLDDEDDFGKRLRENRQGKIEFDTIYFLHGLGYTLFNINNLTYAEINELVDAHNRDVDKKNSASKTTNKK